MSTLLQRVLKSRKVPSNDKISKSGAEEISEVHSLLQKENSYDILILNKDDNLNNIMYYSNSNTSTKYNDSNINNSILKLSKHVWKNINSAKKDFDHFYAERKIFKMNVPISLRKWKQKNKPK